MTPAPLAVRSPFRAEHVAMALAGTALTVLVVLPLVSLVVASVTDEGRLTLGHFRDALSRRLYVQALKNSLILGAWTALLSVAIGLPMAWAVSRTDVPAKPFIHVTATIAYLTPPYLTAIAFVNLFSPNAGLVNQWLRDVLGLPQLTFNIHSMAGLVLVTVLHTFPFVYLLAASALESVDASMEESARILGAGRWRTARAVTLPLVAPAILAGSAGGVRQRDRAVRLSGHHRPAGTHLHPAHADLRALRPPAAVRPRVRAVAALRRDHGRGARAPAPLPGPALVRDPRTGKGNRPRVVPLGWARWGALGFCVGVFVVAVLAPYLTLLAVSVSKSWGLAFWQNLTLQHYRFILLEYDVTRRAIVNSLGLAAAAATLTVLLGSLIAWGDLRTRLPGRKLLDYVSLVPLGLPGIVMAVALIQFWLRVPVPIYGTLLIILLAYTGRYVPLAARSANAAFRQVDASLEETARVTGAGWLRTFGSITLPLARPGLFAGLAPRVRAGDPGAQRLDPPLQLRVDHAGGGRLQPLRDRIPRAGGGPGDRDHGDHRQRHLAGDAAEPRRCARRAAGVVH